MRFATLFMALFLAAPATSATLQYGEGTTTAGRALILRTIEEMERVCPGLRTAIRRAHAAGAWVFSGDEVFLDRQEIYGWRREVMVYVLPGDAPIRYYYRDGEKEIPVLDETFDFKISAGAGRKTGIVAFKPGAHRLCSLPERKGTGIFKPDPAFEFLR